MKRIITIVILTLSLTLCYGAKPLKPWTQGGFESGKYRNLFVELGYKKADVDKKVREVFEEVFFGPNKVYFEVGDSLAYVSDIKNNDVRTEGMSYGMMVAVQMGRKDIFDKLWRWSKKYMQHQDGPLQGYFAWSCKIDGTRNSQGPASDGELYFVTSLLFASNLWGNATGINYKAEAQNILDCAFSKKGMDRVTNFINESNHLITFTPDPMGASFTDPSYHIPAFYEVWAKYAEDGRAPFWRECAKASREYLHKCINPKTGLNPDQSNYDGTLRGGDNPWMKGSANFRYDSWRVPMNITLDYEWSCADAEWQRNYASTIQKFFYSQGVNKFVDQYRVDGSLPEGNEILPAGRSQRALRHSVGLVGTIAATSQMATDRKMAKKFVDALWKSKNVPFPDGYFDAYYDGLLRLFAFMHLSGNYRIIEPVWQYPFQNPELSVDERVENLISLLTPIEKVGLVMNKSVSVDRLGIPSYNWWSEACHGVRQDGYTVYPQNIGLGATFNPEQIYEIFSTVSDEARANWNRSRREYEVGMRARYYPGNPELSFWCPNINIFRDPRWGRGQETIGEDPYLTSIMGVETVRGMQGNDDKYYKTHACAKHYGVHSGPEPLRHRFDVSVSMRDLWETYLPAFKALVTEADVQEVMCAYQRYDGLPCCMSNRLLEDILRNKWGYQSLVVTDCDAINNFYTRGQHETHPDAVHASADAIKAGADLECGNSYVSLIEGLEKGLLVEADIDKALRRVLKGRFELGMFDPAEMLPWADLDESVISSEANDALARKAAQESMVLLKNDGILPLSKSVKKIAVVGPNADNAAMLYGNYGGTPVKEHERSILDGIRMAVPNAEIVYSAACQIEDEYNTIDHMPDFNEGEGMKVEFFEDGRIGDKPSVTRFFKESINFSTFGAYGFSEGVDAAHVAVRMTGKIVPDFTGDLKYVISSDNGYKLFINGKLFEEAGPSARGFGMRRGFDYKSIPAKAGEHLDVVVEYIHGNGPFAMLSAQFCERKLAEFSDLARQVADADAIIVVGGITASQEGEGGDRTSIEFPAVQSTLVRAMHETGKPVVLVNCSGSAMAFTAIEDQCNSILQAWYPGQAGALALADILFGDYNPSGKLPVTFYASTSQLPEFTDYRMENRTYRYFHGTPEFPFGFGLSYTTFEIGEAALSKSSIKAGEGLEVTVPVTNSGKMAGDEVVQIYVKSIDNPDAPIKSLKGFQRVSVKPGQTISTTISLRPDSFEFFNGEDDLAVMPGRYEILYGTSSADSDLKSLDLIVTK